MTEIQDLVRQATGISCHTSHVLPGHIFVALKGRKQNGNEFVHLAAKMGAAAIITDEPNSIQNLAIPLFTVHNARKFLADAAADFYHHPSRKLCVTGITGTNGKTTIAYMLHSILQQAGLHSGLIGTVQVQWKDHALPSTLTTPDAIALQSYLSQMLQDNVTHVVMEVSAQGIEMHRVHNTNFSCGILSNITPDHLDFHTSFAEYLQAKQQFLNLLSPAQPLIVNIGDPHCRKIAQAYTGSLVRVNYNHDAMADVEVNIVKSSAFYSNFELLVHKALTTTIGTIVQPGQYPLTIRLPGRHNIENAALSSVAAMMLGIDYQHIAIAIQQFHPVERRMVVSHQQGITIIDDTALNPGSMDAVFSALNSIPYHHLIVVNAIRGNRGTAINILNAACLAKWQRQIGFTAIITASHQTMPASDTVSPEEQAAFLSTLDQQQSRYIFKESLNKAIYTALTLTNKGDLLLLIGAQGMDHGYTLVQEMLQNTQEKPVADDFCHQPMFV